MSIAILSRRRPQDIPTLIQQLGGNAVVPCFYDARRNVTASDAVDSWADARGSAGYGPTLLGTSTARPSQVTLGLSFDGINDNMRGSSGALSLIVDSMWVALVCTIPTDTGLTQVCAALDMSAAQALSTFLPGTQSFSTIASSGSANLVTSADTTHLHVVHARVTQSGGNQTVGIQVGSGVETTATGAGAATPPTRFTLGANRANTPASFAGVTVRAAIVGLGDYTAAKHVMVNTWAQRVHGALLT